MSNKRRRCPGQCGQSIVKSRFSCADCWDRLPDRLRRPILATMGKPTSRTKTLARAIGAEYLSSRNPA